MQIFGYTFGCIRLKKGNILLSISTYKSIVCLVPQPIRMLLLLISVLGRPVAYHNYVSRAKIGVLPIARRPSAASIRAQLETHS